MIFFCVLWDVVGAAVILTVATAVTTKKVPLTYIFHLCSMYNNGNSHNNA